MSSKTRLNKLEKMGSANKTWAFIGIGKPVDQRHQLKLEVEARDRFYADGGDKGAHIAFLPFECFKDGFIGYMKQSSLEQMISNKTKNPAES